MMLEFDNYTEKLRDKRDFVFAEFRVFGGVFIERER